MPGRAEECPSGPHTYLCALGAPGHHGAHEAPNVLFAQATSVSLQADQIWERLGLCRWVRRALGPSGPEVTHWGYRGRHCSGPAAGGHTGDLPRPCSSVQPCALTPPVPSSGPRLSPTPPPCVAHVRVSGASSPFSALERDPSSYLSGQRPHLSCFEFQAASARSRPVPPGP